MTTLFPTASSARQQARQRSPGAQPGTISQQGLRAPPGMADALNKAAAALASFGRRMDWQTHPAAAALQLAAEIERDLMLLADATTHQPPAPALARAIAALAEAAQILSTAYAARTAKASTSRGEK